WPQLDPVDVIAIELDLAQRDSARGDQVGADWRPPGAVSRNRWHSANSRRWVLWDNQVPPAPSYLPLHGGGRPSYVEALSLAPIANEDCIFCQIVAGKEPASFVYQDPLVVAFMDIQPITRGHMLVVP